MIERNEARPEVGVYVGRGASHSWTWFADIFDRAGYYDVSFLNEGILRMAHWPFVMFFLFPGVIRLHWQRVWAGTVRKGLKGLFETEAHI